MVGDREGMASTYGLEQGRSETRPGLFMLETTDGEKTRTEEPSTDDPKHNTHCPASINTITASD